MAAAVFAMRLPEQVGHAVRDLHENATSKSWPHVSHQQRVKPSEKIPQAK
jgi:hypothetical protein